MMGLLQDLLREGKWGVGMLYVCKGFWRMDFVRAFLCCTPRRNER